MKHAKTIVLALAVMAASGCMTGRHTLRVTTDPPGARLYHKGRLLGETPVSVPMRWYFVGAGGWLATVPVRVEKEGFEPLDTFLRPPVNAPGRPPAWRAGSEFGWGKTAAVHLGLRPRRANEPAWEPERKEQER